MKTNKITKAEYRKQLSERIIKNRETSLAGNQKREFGIRMAIVKMYLAEVIYNKPMLVSYEFNGESFHVWLSHKGCARASDASFMYPEAIESYSLPFRMKAYGIKNFNKLPTDIKKLCKLHEQIYSKR